MNDADYQLKFLRIKLDYEFDKLEARKKYEQALADLEAEYRSNRLDRIEASENDRERLRTTD